MRATMTTTRQTIQPIRAAGRIATRGTETSTPDRRRRTRGAAAATDIADAWARRASRASGFGDAGF